MKTISVYKVLFVKLRINSAKRVNLSVNGERCLYRVFENDHYFTFLPPSQPSPMGEGDHFPLGGNEKGGY
jgi:hypothetical protein